MRAELGIGRDDFLAGLITSGDFLKRGVRIFLEALRLLPAPNHGPRLHVLIAGKEHRWRDYAALARDSGHDARIHVLEPRPDVERLYHALDLYVHPALYEEFGQSVQEALACGVPVLISPRVGASELLPPALRTLAVVEPTPAALSQAIGRLMRDAPARDAISRAGPDAVKGNTWDVNWAATRRIYDEIFAPARL
jgi:UDP-glucose:(heptosyl)LPS alpha-1,3-glucosyltransferase